MCLWTATVILTKDSCGYLAGNIRKKRTEWGRKDKLSTFLFW